MNEKSLPNHLAPYYFCLVDSFLNEVKKNDSSSWQPSVNGKPYYYKWILTLQVSKKLNVSSSVVRKNLTELEKMGYVEAERNPNYIKWAAKYIDGFEQAIYLDYYWRS